MGLFDNISSRWNRAANGWLYAELRLINFKLEQIMTTQAEFEVQMNALADQAEKDKAEVIAATAVATQAIADLEAALAAGGNVSDGVLAAFDRAKAAVQGIDDLNADAP